MFSWLILLVINHPFSKNRSVYGGKQIMMAMPSIALARISETLYQC